MRTQWSTTNTTVDRTPLEQRVNRMRWDVAANPAMRSSTSEAAPA